MRVYAVTVKSITEILVDPDIYLKSFHDSYLFLKTITVKTVWRGTEALEFLIILWSKIKLFFILLGAPVLPVIVLVTFYVSSLELEAKFSSPSHVVSLRYTEMHLSLKRDEEKF